MMTIIELQGHIPSQLVSDSVSIGLRFRLSWSQIPSQSVSDYVSVGLRLRLSRVSHTSQ